MTDTTSEPAENKIEDVGKDDPFAGDDIPESDPEEATENVLAEFQKFRFPETQEESETKQGPTTTPDQGTQKPSSDEGVDFADLDERQKLDVIEYLDTEVQKAQQEAEQLRGQKPQGNDQGILEALQSNPQLLQALTQKQPQQGERFELDPEEFDPFELANPNSDSSKWLQQLVNDRAAEIANQTVQQQIKPIQQEITKTRVMSESDQYGIPDELQDDWIEFLNQDPREVLQNPERLAQLFLAEQGNGNEPEQPSQEVNVEQIVERIRQQKRQKNTSPAGNVTNQEAPPEQNTNPFKTLITQMAKQDEGVVP